MRGIATIVVASMLWAIFGTAASLAGVPGQAAPAVVGVLATVGVFAMASFGYRARRDHAEEIQ